MNRHRSRCEQFEDSLLVGNLMFGISIPYSLEKGSSYTVFHDTLSDWPGYANIMDIIDEVEITISESIPSLP